ncbi:MAG: hypothetical protein WD669_08945 [Pirellulales bacterium]
MASGSISLRDRGLGHTQRRDAWWAGPLVTGLVLGGFVIYTTFRIVQNAYFQFGHGVDGTLDPEHAYLLSPMYSPLLALPAWVPAWISPAMFILWMPGGFRLTCYYYRKAYYRAFFLDPPACSVGEPRDQYQGETRLLLFQNIHRYFLYIALIFIVILGYDAIHSFLWPTAGGGYTFGISLGSIVLTTGATLLALYTFSCHSLRHLVGGNVDCFSCVRGGQARYKLWRGTTRLNEHHMLWAWTSLFGVTFADLYVWLVASGTITDNALFKF